MAGYELSSGVFPQPMGRLDGTGNGEPSPVFEEKDMTAIYYFFVLYVICTERDMCTYMIIFW